MQRYVNEMSDNITRVQVGGPENKLGMNCTVVETLGWIYFTATESDRRGRSNNVSNSALGHVALDKEAKKRLRIT